MLTISEANYKYVNYKEPLTYRQALGYLMPLNGKKQQTKNLSS